MVQSRSNRLGRSVNLVHRRVQETRMDTRHPNDGFEGRGELNVLQNEMTQSAEAWAGWPRSSPRDSFNSDALCIAGRWFDTFRCYKYGEAWRAATLAGLLPGGFPG